MKELAEPPESNSKAGNYGVSGTELVSNVIGALYTSTASTSGIVLAMLYARRL